MLSLIMSLIKQSEPYGVQNVKVQPLTETTYREEHTLALSDNSTTAKEPDEEQHRPERYQQVSHIQQLSHLLRRIFNFFD